MVVQATSQSLEYWHPVRVLAKILEYQISRVTSLQHNQVALKFNIKIVF